MSDGPDYQLRQMVNTLDGKINTVGQQVDLVGQSVRSVESATIETRSALQLLQMSFDEYRHTQEFRHNLTVAKQEVARLEGEVDREYGYQAEVRRCAAGTLKAFDEGLIYRENLTSILQGVYIKAPGYWLAPALVALVEWTDDNREYCDRAIESAYKRNASNTSLFFALILRRQGRVEASLRWLKHYLTSQDPRHLTSDFATVLEAVAQGAFTAAGREIVQEHLERWRQLLSDDEAAIDDQVRHWEVEIHGHVEGTNSSSYPALAAFSPEWGRLDASLCGAQTHSNIADKYGAMLIKETRVTNSLEDRVDDILDRLVKDRDPKEIPLQEDLARQRAIVKSGGNIEAARAEGELDAAAFTQTKNYFEVQTMSALRPESLNVSAATQKVAVGACADWFHQAHKNHTIAYQQTLPSDVTAKFSAQHSVAASTFKLPSWTSSFNRPAADLERDLANHWDKHMAPWLETLRYQWKRAIIAPIIVSVLVLLIVGAIANFGVSIVMALIIFGIWGGKIWSRHKAAEQSILAAKAVLSQAKKQSLDKLRMASAELQDWQRAYQDHDAKGAEVTKLIDDFRGMEVSQTSSLEHRVINTDGWMR